MLSLTLPAELPLPLLLSLGFVVGLLSGLLGIGGGWLITPSLNAFGLPMTSAVATGLAQMSGTSLLALNRHRKHGNVDFKLGLIIGVSMILSVNIGKSILLYLEKSGYAGLLTRGLYITLLSTISIAMFKELLQKKEKEKTFFLAFFSFLKKGPTVNLPRFKTEAHLLLLVFLGVFAGLLSGIMGVGGGFILVPAITFLFGLPTLAAVATSLVCVFFAGASGSYFYTLAGKVHWKIALIIIAGSFFGSMIGVSSTKYIKERSLRFLFAFLTLSAAFSSVFKQFDLPQLAKVTITIPAGMILLYSLGALISGKTKEKKNVTSPK
jgi:uncharacterized membrane protein YfcA